MTDTLPLCRHSPPKARAGEPFVLGQDCHVCWQFLNPGQRVSIPEGFKSPFVPEVDCTKPNPFPSIKKIPGQGPSLIIQAGNLISAVATHVTRGMKTCTEEEVKSRLDVCHSCPFYNQEKDTCKVCGCHLSIKAKWREQQCPKGYWPPMDPEK